MATRVSVCDVVQTELCPDVLQWNEREQLLLVGTYELNKETGHKQGALGLAKVYGEGSTPTLAVQSWLSGPAVLDAKWLVCTGTCGPSEGTSTSTSAPPPRSLVAAAMHDGSVRLYATREDASAAAPTLQEYPSKQSSTIRLCPQEEERGHDEAHAGSTEQDEEEDGGDTAGHGGGLGQRAASALYVDWAVAANGQQDQLMQQSVDEWKHSLLQAVAEDSDKDEDEEGDQEQASAPPMGSGSSDTSPLPPLAVSCADGTVHVLTSRESGLSPAVSWQAHTLGGVGIEAWVVSWYRATHARLGTMLWSGGDDGKLKGWDLRSMGGAVSHVGPGRYSIASPRPVFTSEAHAAGVTCIEWHPTLDNIVATGSYDETLRIWDCRRMDAPVSKSSPGRLRSTFSAGGGVWRLAWHPSHANASWALVGCMYNGVHVLNWPDSLASSASSASDVEGASAHHYKGHSTISYPVQWLPQAQAQGGASRAVTAGFYDKEIHLLEVDGI